MRSFPFLNDFCKRWKDLFRMECIPAYFRTDGLFLQFSGTPDERRAKGSKQSRDPEAGNEQRTDHQQNPEPHYIRPPKVAKIAFPPDNPDESKPNDEYREKTEYESEEVHAFVSSVSCSRISLTASL